MARNPNHFRPTLESLEHRVVADAKVWGGYLQIEGTQFSDKVVVQEVLVAKVGQVLRVYEQAGLIRKKPVEFLRSDAPNGIRFNGYEGNDRFNYTNTTKTPDLPIYARGGPGNDTLVGAGAADSLYGEAGNDVLQGWGGNDVLTGGAGSDRMWGGNGDDIMWGGDRPTALGTTGVDGRDTMYGESGDDYLDGGHELNQTADLLVGGRGADTFRADTWWREHWDNGILWKRVKLNLDRPSDPRPIEGDKVIDLDGSDWTEETIFFPPPLR